MAMILEFLDGLKAKSEEGRLIQLIILFIVVAIFNSFIVGLGGWEEYIFVFVILVMLGIFLVDDFQKVIIKEGSIPAQEKALVRTLEIMKENKRGLYPIVLLFVGAAAGGIIGIFIILAAALWLQRERRNPICPVCRNLLVWAPEVNRFYCKSCIRLYHRWYSMLWYSVPRVEIEGEQGPLPPPPPLPASEGEELQLPPPP